MKKLLFLNIFILILVSLSAQNYELVKDPVDTTLFIISQSEDLQPAEDQEATGKDSARTLNKLFRLIGNEYLNISQLEQELERAKKSLKTLVKLPEKINPDTSYSDFAEAKHLNKWLGEYKFFVETIDTFDVVIDQTAGGNVRIKEDITPANAARKYNISINSERGITIKKLDIGDIEYKINLNQNPLNPRVFNSSNYDVKSINSSIFIPRVKLRRKK